MNVLTAMLQTVAGRTLRWSRSACSAQVHWWVWLSPLAGKSPGPAGHAGIYPHLYPAGAGLLALSGRDGPDRAQPEPHQQGDPAGINPVTHSKKAYGVIHTPFVVLLFLGHSGELIGLHLVQHPDVHQRIRPECHRGCILRKRPCLPAGSRPGDRRRCRGEAASHASGRVPGRP